MKHLVRFRMLSELLSMCCRCAVFFLLWLGDDVSSALCCLWVAPTLSVLRPLVAIFYWLFVMRGYFCICANLQLFH